MFWRKLVKLNCKTSNNHISKNPSNVPLKRKMVNVNLIYGTHVTDNDPKQHPVLIIGQLKNLNRIKFDDIKCKLGGRVSEEDFQIALKRFTGSQNDPVSLYLNQATLAPLPDQASRHNAPSRPHALTKLIKSETFDVDGENILVVCERKDMFALGCAVARAFPMYSRKMNANKENATVTVEFLLLEEGAITMVTKEEATVLQSAADGIRMAARIVDTPCNEMNVDHFVSEVQRVGQLLNVAVTVIRGEELREKGMGGIYGVGKAAACPPALAVLSYTPSGATQTIAWVGKGIVYDTGGLSIKTKTTMPGMKRDCGGAAGILGAFYSIVRQGFTQNLHAVFCLAENSVGPNSTRPDDIHTLYSGRTVEINNTDAEGRLVLSDGVVYASRDLKADLILDMATLTGAQAMSTGKYHAAVLTNSAEWEKNVVTAGQVSGDLAFPIVYCPELHFSEYNSAVADMKNSVADRQNALSSCAGLFIAAHLDFDFPGVWIHVDMASPVHAGERATGYGVALLTALFGGLSSDKFLQYVGQDVVLNISNLS
ncbi:probable aminopeptidase NPEPL1 isoform X1 [Homalodisca vitripennis]|uniref:probable aminopeptidase NPEPL1 isoform X1 n=2 Tax=Homalodisca vitripennis TaxID=197043 RepID=UPI001EEC405A|nr:probable aminopeptidase NPEPL1 isoform X1 [Homalodisca vitripennis]